MIKYLVMDVDGTLTDGKIYIGDAGEIMKAFSVKDGYGIYTLLPKIKIEPVVITGRKSRILENRCRELGINKLYQGIKHKETEISNIFSDLSSVAYIGDDMNDYMAMMMVKNSGGKIGCPANSCNEIIAISDFVSTRNGGEGSVREFIEWLSSI